MPWSQFYMLVAIITIAPYTSNGFAIAMSVVYSIVALWCLLVVERR